MQVCTVQLLAVRRKVDVLGEGIVDGLNTLLFGLSLEHIPDVLDGPLVDGGKHLASMRARWEWYGG